MTAAPVFAAELSGPGHAALRRHVAALRWEVGAGALHVSTVLGRWARRDAAEPGARPACHLLLDLHRLFVYDEPEDAEGARVDSVVRALVDAYSFQPFAL
ncbi:MAG TPA: hypothetical protein VFH27_01615, partial [Longimicrobiaceae bacterium]|nr:hypothetical protein [Longimicrobiaceae bacterium]